MELSSPAPPSALLQSLICDRWVLHISSDLEYDNEMIDVHLNLLLQNVDAHHDALVPPEHQTREAFEQSKTRRHLDKLMAVGLLAKKWPHFGGVLPGKEFYTLEGKNLYANYYEYKARYNLIMSEVFENEDELVSAIAGEMIAEFEYFFLDRRRPGLKVFFYMFSESHLIVDPNTFEPTYKFSARYLITDPVTPKLIPDTSIRETLRIDSPSGE